MVAQKIQMVDLIGQYEKIQSEIDNTVLSVIRSSAYINGPEVKEFQKELEAYLDVKHVIPCANGTDALQIAMMALNLQPGDEVITASFTYVATAEVIALLKLKPVLVDVYPDTFDIDVKAMEAAITPKTKAIVPVHLFGQCANMEAIMEVAKKHNLYVIEDTAQAIGSNYTFSNGKKQKAGTIGTIGCTSFFPSKNLGCFGDGGAIFTNDNDLAKKIRMIANHGQSVQYVHDEVGVNSRLDSIQAAILRVKLRHLDEYAKARNAAAAYYDNA
ncbi:MAG TPA: DegT/DnrJ/EryC1/StrS family aminotransferase, partial [Flavobacteriales bacterium]|nr:DegT/DnrJ/EryC1/StrS family aminotransferase [Flavobacteriales bacterium]